VEPVFANLRHTKGMRRFTLRGKANVATQWQLYCLVHNIEKIATVAMRAARKAKPRQCAGKRALTSPAASGSIQTEGRAHIARKSSDDYSKLPRPN
jgi:Transposase DDE domain